MKDPRQGPKRGGDPRKLADVAEALRLTITPVSHATQVACDALGDHALDAPAWRGAGWKPETAPAEPDILLHKPRDAAIPYTAQFDPEVRDACLLHVRAVARVEARNSSRLRTLLWAVSTLRELDGSTTARDMADELARWIAQHYPGLLRVRDALGTIEPHIVATPATIDRHACPYKWREAAQRGE